MAAMQLLPATAEGWDYDDRHLAVVRPDVSRCTERLLYEVFQAQDLQGAVGAMPATASRLVELAAPTRSGPSPQTHPAARL